jgi:hypothetical protein
MVVRDHLEEVFDLKAEVFDLKAEDISTEAEGPFDPQSEYSSVGNGDTLHGGLSEKCL